MLTPESLNQLEAHLDERGTVEPEIVRELIEEVRRLNGVCIEWERDMKGTLATLERERAEVSRLRRELESTIRRETQDRDTGYAWMDKYMEAERRERGLLDHLRRITKAPRYQTSTDHHHWYEVEFWDIEEARRFIDTAYPEPSEAA